MKPPIEADLAAFAELQSKLGKRAVVETALEDLEQEMAPKKKRKKPKQPTERTLEECRKRGWIAGIVERRIPFPKPQGTTIDLLGIIDVVAIDTSVSVSCAGCGRHQTGQTVGIQATSGSNHASRRAKILAEPRALQWLNANNRLELWTFSPRGAAGKRKLWTLRVEVFTVEDWSER